MDGNERRCGDVAIGKLFKDQGRIGPRQRGATDILADINTCKAQLGSLFDHIDGEMAVAVPCFRMWQQLRLGKLAGHVPDHQLFVGKQSTHC